MANVNILDSVAIDGEDVLFKARAAVKRFKGLGSKVPKMEIRGGWLMNGFSFDFDEYEDAFPPLGSKYIKAGPKAAQVEPTETSEMRIYFVHSGEGITDKNPLATGDLFADEPVEEEGEETDATEPADDDTP